MKMKVAFITSAYRTVFFWSLAKHIENAGHKVFWISPNRRWARWLVNQNVSEEQILDITRYGHDWTAGSMRSITDRQELSNLEGCTHWNINNLIMMDPLLSRRKYSHSLQYLSSCYNRISKFLLSAKIAIVFGERAWALELITDQICQKHGISFLLPDYSRIPNNRFLFFSGPIRNQIVPIREITDKDLIDAESLVKDFRNNTPRPDYMLINKAVLQFNKQRLYDITKHLICLTRDKFDETSRRPMDLILEHIRQILRSKLSCLSGVFENPVHSPGRPYVLFLLQKQPESSINVQGVPFCNQVEISKALGRTLPINYDLYIKEHIVALPHRPIGFYRRLRQIPGAQLISPFANTFDLMRHAELVVTITGTGAFEAALLGRPAATIAPIYFDKIVRFPRYNPFETSLTQLIEEAQKYDSQITGKQIEFVAFLLAQSFPGEVGDALWIPKSMNSENIEQVAKGFLGVMRVYEHNNGNKQLYRVIRNYA